VTLMIKRFPPDVYNRYLTLVYGTIPQIDAAMQRELPRRLDIPSSDYTPLQAQNTGRFVVFRKDGRVREYILITDPTAPGRDYNVCGTLGHEVLHYVFWVLGNAGILLHESSEEAFTYYFDFVFGNCMAALETTPALSARRKRQ
jgi:hypothetical protein